VCSPMGRYSQKKHFWTLEGFRALEQHYVLNPDAGDGAFLEKLREQLASAQPKVIRLAAEMMWVMVLCPSNLQAANKRDQVVPVWGWSGATLTESPWLEDGVLVGVGSAGQGFNTNRWKEWSFSFG
jgi:5-methylcytosine-specific restriction protein B